MKISTILKITKSTLLTEGVDLEQEIKGGFAGDLMSDVLASINPDAVLITGLSNPQVVRTAMIADAKMIIFARGKHPSQETLALAESESIPVAASPMGLYAIAGILTQAGLPSYENPLYHKPKKIDK